MFEKATEKIRKAREAKKLSMREVARRTGVSVPYMHSIDHGTATCAPSEPVISQIASVLDLDETELCRLFHRVPMDVTEYVLRTPGAIEALKAAARKRLSGEKLKAALGV